MISCLPATSPLIPAAAHSFADASGKTSSQASNNNATVFEGLVTLVSSLLAPHIQQIFGAAQADIMMTAIARAE